MKKEDFLILVADDDEIARDAMSLILQQEGFPVITARDGIEAINLIRRGNINLVITDLRMPGADGIEVLKYAVKNNPDTPVVLITAFGTIDIALEAMKEGAYDYLAKPFKREEIVFLVKKAFETTILRRELKELKDLLRKTYRDIETLKNITKNANPEIINSWLARIEDLTQRGILDEDEAKLLRERIIRGQ